ncbi:alpha/beta hydrolase [Agreia sp. PsM10]|uniref:alpha/beta hydrolase n=1 Tax=Agreia sp. PsM10 TaxID=3030533 RepID=UPI00263AC33E|nr:alpha/beta hydrolase [Agreia sp. PsM10]MDN4638992.1 alpha/beta hydrolase [Agreia sp. PsM10]
MRRLLVALCGMLLVTLVVVACGQAWQGRDDADRVAAASAAQPPDQVLVAGVTSEVFSSAEEASDVQVLFIHGGSYVHEASALHAPFFEQILDTVDATVTMPIYALAPEHGYRVAYEQIMDVYLELRRSHPDSPIVLMGGSAGGGFALGFAESLLEQGIAQPDRIVLLSPWLDLTLTNPAIPAVDATDVLLDREALVPNGLAWAHGDDPSGYRLSPVNGTLTGLAPTTVLAGTNDILYPDTLVLEARAEAAGLDFELTSFTGADHVFAMTSGSAGDEARAIIEAIIGSLD